MSFPSKAIEVSSAVGKVRVTPHALQRMVQRVGSVDKGVSLLASATVVLKGDELSRYTKLGRTEATYGLRSGRHLFIISRGKLQAPQLGSVGRLAVKTVICVPPE